MKQVSVTLSTYTADVSGVCSALYELGGMVVIHDRPAAIPPIILTMNHAGMIWTASYLFPDFHRWTLLWEMMINSSMTLVRAAKELKPRFIALVRTPIPLMTGTDFEGIARIIEKQTQIPVFYFPTSGMHSYVSGAGMALETVARELVLPTNANGHFKENGIEIENVSNELSVADTKKQNQQKLNQSEQKQIENTESKQSNSKIKINILGATPLDFSVNSTLDSIKEFLSKHFEIISTFAMGSSIEDIQKAGEADVNLVISSVGFPAAKVLEERFSTPYVIGTPVKGFAGIIAEKLIDAAWTGKSQTAYFSVTSSGKNISRAANGIYIIGESVISQSLKAAMALKQGIDATVICPLETEPEYIGENVLLFHRKKR